MATRIDELMRGAAARLAAAGDIDAEADARWLMRACMVCGAAGLRFGPPPDAAQEARFEDMVNRRAAGEPLQYILGNQPFLGRIFKADRRALIPRPETEELCLKALQLMERSRAPRALDMGTGTGVLAVSIALARPDARVTAVDISPEALSLARENADLLGAEVEFLKGDMFEPVRGRRFDLIVSNPPYLSGADMAALQREVRREPALALYGGPDGLDFYRRFAKEAAGMLAPDGHVAFEVGMGQARTVAGFMAGTFRNIEICRDINGVERIVSAELAGRE